MDDALTDLTRKRLATVLLEFGQAPGKYPVRLGEPRELHTQLDTVTVWALGRLPEELEPQAAQLREAAVMFIARACFAPEGTHYQMFGLTPAACTPEALRARYRNLIRLTHPDMGIKGLPSNAAGIVNRAHGVLSDADSRRRYDDELAERKSMVMARERPTPAQSVRRIEHRISIAERWQSLKARFPRQLRLGIFFGGMTVLASAFLAWALTGQHDEQMLIAGRDIAADTPVVVKSGTSANKENLRPTGQRPAEGTNGSQLRDASAERGAVPATVVPPAPVPNPGLKEATPAIPTPAAPPQPPAPVAPAAPAQVLAALTAPIAPKTPAPAPRDQAAASQPPPVGSVSTDTGKSVVTAERNRTAPTPDQSRQAPTLAASTGTPEMQSETAKAVSAPAPAPSVATTAPASTGTRSAAAATVATTTTTPPPAVAAQAWGVDKAKALQYLSELFGVLEHPTRALKTNTYLSDMKVKGSLFQPALLIMQDYPEIDVARVDWADTATPGVLKIRGNLMLQAKSPNTPAVRFANFRFTAEFWGTPTGTVLGELSLRESE